MKKNVLFFLASFALYSLFCQESKSVDSLLLRIENTSGIEKAMSYHALSMKYYDKNDSLALDYINKSFAHVSENDTVLAKLTFHKGMIYELQQQYGLATELLKESYEYLKPYNISTKGEILTWLRYMYQENGQYPEALLYGQLELDFYKQSDSRKNWVVSGLEMGYTYDRMGEYERAIQWHKEYLKRAEEYNLPEQIARGNGLIGIAYDELKQYDSALYYNKKAVELFKQNGQNRFLKTWYSNIANTYTKLNRLDLAEEYILNSLNLVTHERQKGIILVNLGKIYLDTGRYNLAEKTLDSALAITVKYDQKRYKSEAFYRMHELSKERNNYREALSNFIKHKEVEDIMLNEAKAEQIAEMTVRYDTNEKERQILQQRAIMAEQNLTLQKRSYQIYALIGFALILGLMGYLFFNQQKLKNRQLIKENQLKSALSKIETQNRLQEQRLRISRDLHDNIGAQLTFIISSIDNLKYGFTLEDKLTQKLDAIGNFTSSTIYELRDTIWAMNKSEVTVDDLHSRISNFIEKADIAAVDTIFNFNVDQNVSSATTLTSVEGMNVYRIIQEAVNNAIKYAKAKKIEVNINKEDNKLIFAIKDDGIGFKPSGNELGNGLNNMKKRAHDIGAEFEIMSEVGKGTTIKLMKS